MAVAFANQSAIVPDLVAWNGTLLTLQPGEEDVAIFTSGSGGANGRITVLYGDLSAGGAMGVTGTVNLITNFSADGQLNYSVGDFEVDADAFLTAFFVNQDAFAAARIVMAGNDVMLGSNGADQLHGFAGNDSITGGAGNDLLMGYDGADFLGGGAGADTMEGGRGNDFYVVDNVGDVVRGEIAFTQGGGIDTVRTFVDFVQPENIELVRLTNINGTANLNAVGNDAPGTLVGNAGNNSLTGRGGNDQLNGNAGNDVITGNTGRDTVVGGAGADTFVYTAYADSRAGAANRDLVNGFDRGFDHIDLSQLDANTGSFGVDDSFEFIGFARFSGAAGELRLQSLGGANAVLVEADHNGDGVADLQVFVNLRVNLDASDFVL